MGQFRFQNPNQIRNQLVLKPTCADCMMGSYASLSVCPSGLSPKTGGNNSYFNENALVKTPSLQKLPIFDAASQLAHCQCQVAFFFFFWLLRSNWNWNWPLIFGWIWNQTAFNENGIGIGIEDAGTRHCYIYKSCDNWSYRPRSREIMNLVASVSPSTCPTSHGWIVSPTTLIFGMKVDLDLG